MSKPDSYIEVWSCSSLSTVSHSPRMASIRLSTLLRTFSHLFRVHEFFIEALARIRVPSTNNVLPAIRSNLRHKQAHCLRTPFNALLLFLLNSAIVLWSGFNPPMSHIKEILWRVARSSFRELLIP